MFKVAVGSLNLVKINAVKSAFIKILGECEVIGCSVLLGVSDMPLSYRISTISALSRFKKLEFYL